MKKLLFTIVLLVSVGCSNSVRINSYETVKQHCHIANILQSDWAVWNAKNVSAIAEKELEIRFDLCVEIIDYLKKITQNGTHGVPANILDEVMNKRKDGMQYFEDIARISESGLISIKCAKEYKKKAEHILESPDTQRVFSKLPPLF